MSDDQPRMYGDLAPWFHLLTAPDEYVDEAAEVLRWLRASASAPITTALELGSGGGNLASHLSADLQLTLTDPSAEMLAVSRQLNPGAEHMLGDMRDLRLARTFDAVIIHDAITYMTTQADLRRAMATAWAHLRTGGAAVFMPDWVRDTFAPATESGGNDEGVRGLRYIEWDRPIEPDGHTVQTDYIIATRDGADIDVHHDLHTLGIFDRAVWMRLLDEVGFDAHRETSDADNDVFVGARH